MTVKLILVTLLAATSFAQEMKFRCRDRPHWKTALYGAGHLLRAVPDPISRLTKPLDTGYPGQTFVVITGGGPHPENQPFERALKTQARPVLVPFGKPPFRDIVVGAFPSLGLLRAK